MPWFKVDDGFYTSSKFLDIPREYQAQAAGLWMLAGVYSAHKMSDGFVSNGQLQLWEFDRESRNWLIAVGLWDEVDNGIQFHDWCDYQPTKESLQAKAVERSEKAKQNVAKRWDKNKSDTKVIPTVYETDTNGYSEPEPEPEPVTSNEVTINTPDFFDDFWEAYPRKTEKPAARKAYAKAVKRAGAQTIIEGASRYSTDPNRDATYTKHASTWLNNDCWDDPLLPDRTPVNAKERQREQAAAEFMASFNQPLEITTNPDWA